MDVLFLLIPLSVLLALAVMGVLAWAVWSGQFEELDSEGQRIFTPKPDLPIDTSLIHINTLDVGAADTQTSLPQKRVHP